MVNLNLPSSLGVGMYCLHTGITNPVILLAVYASTLNKTSNFPEHNFEMINDNFSSVGNKRPAKCF